MSIKPVYAYAKINAKIMPMVRGELFEDPLLEALEEKGFGTVGGGGTMAKGGDIQYCGIDIDLTDVENGAPFVCDFLTRRGAPRGSVLSYTFNEQKIEHPFGVMEGLAICLNGTDLPKNVYAECDVNVVIETINRMLKGEGCVWDNWHGPRETALYVYGKSADRMKSLIADFMATYPLCQRARIVQIA